MHHLIDKPLYKYHSMERLFLKFCIRIQNLKVHWIESEKMSGTRRITIVNPQKYSCLVFIFQVDWIADCNSIAYPVSIRKDPA